jgi:hypothetical protein
MLNKDILVRASWREVLSNAGDLHVLDTRPGRDRCSGKHRLAQLSTHELAFDTRSLRDVDRGLGRANRGLHLESANQDDDMNGHSITQLIG